MLPLDNYSGDPKQDYFADGMTDELTTDLATISALRVISRGSVMQFKGSHRPPTPEIAKPPNAPGWVAAWLGYAYGISGDRAKVRTIIEELNRKSLHRYAPPFNLAIVYLGMGDRQRALDNVETAYAAHSVLMAWLKMDRIFDPLRSEPRFIALMKKLNFDK